MHYKFYLRVAAGVLTGFVVFMTAALAVVAYDSWETKNRQLEPSFASKTSALPFSMKISGSRSSLPGRPSISRESVMKALEEFKINLPKNVNGPFIDSNMNDRGMTMRKGALTSATVYLGPEAFASWALLGSTLAHEIEIHCRQNFLSIHFQNMAGIDSIGAAEREAYGYELANASRFGLSDYDQALIRSTSSYYYPVKTSAIAEGLKPVRSWIDRFAANSAINGTF